MKLEDDLMHLCECKGCIEIWAIGADVNQGGRVAILALWRMSVPICRPVLFHPS